LQLTTSIVDGPLRIHFFLSYLTSATMTVTSHSLPLALSPY